DGAWPDDDLWVEDHEQDDPRQEPRGPVTVAAPETRPAPAPARRPRRHRLGARILALVILILLAGVAYFAYALFQPGKGSGSGRVAVQIPTGAGAREIGDLLARKGVVDSGFLFSLRSTLGGTRGALRSGHFVLHRDMSYASALTALTAVPSAAPVVEVGVPEGRSIGENAPTVKARGLRGSYVKATHRAPPRRFGAPRGTHTLEGLLFPATYQLRRHAAVAALVGKQRAAFEDNLKGISLAAARAKHLTPYDVVTIASLIEREAGAASDRPKIAAVVYNRLHRSMPLGIDASLRYGLNQWTHPITQSELAAKTPYNLSKRLGLPPTPIGNPGLAALRAAAHPAKAGYLYFVARAGACRTLFFRSYDAFLRASNAYATAQQKAQSQHKRVTTCPGG
ncbi:MAG TPA: endolytic transglycosylase MltG, partial [Solirubrobacteraceae bacterium]